MRRKDRWMYVVTQNGEVKEGGELAQIFCEQMRHFSYSKMLELFVTFELLNCCWVTLV